ncbi:MAG: hypothetical protein M3Y13_12825 [Armatimonadota bacterium]|nr:hypothetical protein [Armatimonadota bacterium]
MAHPDYTTEEIVRRGKALYDQQIRPQVEASHGGKVVVVNIETGEYEIDQDHLAASNRAAVKFPGAALYAMRIGSPALGRLGARSPVKAL